MTKSTRIMRVSPEFRIWVDDIKNNVKNSNGVLLHDSQVTTYIKRKVVESGLDFKKVKIPKHLTKRKRMKNSILDMELGELGNMELGDIIKKIRRK